MRKSILITIIVFVLVGISFAKNEKKESIRQLFALMKQDSVMIKAYASVQLITNRSFTAQIKDSCKLAQSRETIQKTKQLMSELYPKIQTEMIDYYDKYFTQSEINDFIRFYKSASGQKMLDASPLIMKEMMSSFQEKYMKEVFDELVKTIVKPDHLNIREPSLRPDSASIAQMKAEYLDMETSNLHNITKEQNLVLKKAKDRVERYVSLENNQYALTAKASDLNMSDRLFELMMSTIKQSNMLIEKLSKQSK